jgi:sulfur carrier protein ThiS
MGNSKHQGPVTVHVKLADFLSRLVPEAEFDMEINSRTTVEEIINVLTVRFGEKFRKAVVDSKGNLHAGIAVVINKRLIPPGQMAKTTIDYKSNISILPLAGGG